MTELPRDRERDRKNCRAERAALMQRLEDRDRAGQSLTTQLHTTESPTKPGQDTNSQPDLTDPEPQSSQDKPPSQPEPPQLVHQPVSQPACRHQQSRGHFINGLKRKVPPKKEAVAQTQSSKALVPNDR